MKNKKFNILNLVLLFVAVLTACFSVGVVVNKTNNEKLPLNAVSSQAEFLSRIEAATGDVSITLTGNLTLAGDVEVVNNITNADSTITTKKITINTEGYKIFIDQSSDVIFTNVEIKGTGGIELHETSFVKFNGANIIEGSIHIPYNISPIYVANGATINDGNNINVNFITTPTNYNDFGERAIFFLEGVNSDDDAKLFTKVKGDAGVEFDRIIISGDSAADKLMLVEKTTTDGYAVCIAFADVGYGKIVNGSVERYYYDTLENALAKINAIGGNWEVLLFKDVGSESERKGQIIIGESNQVNLQIITTGDGVDIPYDSLTLYAEDFWVYPGSTVSLCGAITLNIVGGNDSAVYIEGVLNLEDYSVVNTTVQYGIELVSGGVLNLNWTNSAGDITGASKADIYVDWTDDANYVPVIVGSTLNKFSTPITLYSTLPGDKKTFVKSAGGANESLVSTLNFALFNDSAYADGNGLSANYWHLEEVEGNGDNDDTLVLTNSYTAKIYYGEGEEKLATKTFTGFDTSTTLNFAEFESAKQTEGFRLIGYTNFGTEFLPTGTAPSKVCAQGAEIKVVDAIANGYDKFYAIYACQITIEVRLQGETEELFKRRYYYNYTTEFDSSITTVSLPEKTIENISGFEFKGWDDTDISTPHKQIVNGAQSFNITGVIGANLTGGVYDVELQAVWEKQYTLYGAPSGWGFDSSVNLSSSFNGPFYDYDLFDDGDSNILTEITTYNDWDNEICYGDFGFDSNFKPNSIPNYKFVGWATSQKATTNNVADNTTVVLSSNSNSITVYAVWETYYTVNHLQQDTNLTTYTNFKTETLWGIIGTQTNATISTPTGFTAQAITQTTIADDHSTVIDIKYDRNSYTITLTAGTGTTLTIEGTHKGSVVSKTATSTYDASATQTFTGYYGLEYTLTAGVLTGYQTLVVEVNDSSVSLTDNKYSFELTATTGIEASATYTPLTFNNQTLPELTYNVGDQTVDFTGASNGTGSYTYTVISSTSSKLTIPSANSPTIKIAKGTNVGTYTLTVKAEDKNTPAEATATITVKITKATPYITVVNDSYAQKFGYTWQDIINHITPTAYYDSSMIDVVEGSFKLGTRNNNNRAQVLESGKYTLTFTPSDTTNYNVKNYETNITITITQEKPVVTISDITIDYGTKWKEVLSRIGSNYTAKHPIDALNVPAVPLDEFEFVNTSLNSSEDFIPVGENTYSVYFYTSSSNYEEKTETTVKIKVNAVAPKSVSVSSLTKNYGELTWQGVLDFANANYTAKGISNETLKGTFTFKDAKTLGDLVNANEDNSYTLVFTPDSSDDASSNYKATETTITITVNAVEAQSVSVSSLTKTYGELTWQGVLNFANANYTAKGINNEALKGSFTFKDSKTLNNLVKADEDNSYTLVFSPDTNDSASSNYKATETTITITVNQATPTYESDIVFTYGSTFEALKEAYKAFIKGVDNQILSGTLSVEVKDNASVTNATVLDVGTYTFVVEFVPTDTTNYTNLTDVEVNVEIQAATNNVSVELILTNTTSDKSLDANKKFTHSITDKLEITFTPVTGYTLPTNITVTCSCGPINYTYTGGVLTITAAELASHGTHNITITVESADKDAPVVFINVVDYNTFEFTATDTAGIVAYAITNSSTTPTSWTTEFKENYVITEAGTYYVWVKDEADNTAYKTIEAYTITVTNKSDNAIDGVEISESGSESIVALNGSIINLVATVKTDTAAADYAFTGWATSQDPTSYVSTLAEFELTVSGSETYYAYATKTDLKAYYTVNHLQQDTNLNTYSNFKTETLRGIIGTQTNATISTPTGFTAQTYSQKTILANGSTVVDIYYNRNTYTITLTAGTGTENLTIKDETNNQSLTITDNKATGYFGLTYTVSATLQTGYNTVSYTITGATNVSGNTFTVSTSDITVKSTATANTISLDPQSFTTTYGVGLSTTFTSATNGTGSYTYTITTGNDDGYFSINGTTLTVSTTTPVNPYEITVKAKDDNSDEFTTATFTITVNQAQMTHSLELKDASKTYTGSALTIAPTGSITVPTGIGSPNVKIVATTGALTNDEAIKVGVYTFTYTYSDPNGNYEDVVLNATLTINAATPVLDGYVLISKNEFTYGTTWETIFDEITENNRLGVAGQYTYFNGADELSTNSVLPVKGNEEEYTITVNFTPTDNVNYTTATTTLTLKIKRADITITVSPLSDTYIYGLQTWETIKNDILGGVQVYNESFTDLTLDKNNIVLSIDSITLEDATVLNAGTYTVKINYTLTGTEANNYNVATEQTCDLTINAAEITTKVQKSDITRNYGLTWEQIVDDIVEPYYTINNGETETNGKWVYKVNGTEITNLESRPDYSDTEYTLTITYVALNEGVSNLNYTSTPKNITVQINQAEVGLTGFKTEYSVEYLTTWETIKNDILGDITVSNKSCTTGLAPAGDVVLTVYKGSTEITDLEKLLNAGDYTVKINYNLTDTKNYINVGEQTTELVITKLKPSIQIKDNKTEFSAYFGTTLTDIFNGYLSVDLEIDGTYSYQSGTTTYGGDKILTPATYSGFIINFTPTDTTNYKTATTQVNLIINSTKIDISGLTFTTESEYNGSSQTPTVTGEVKVINSAGNEVSLTLPTPTITGPTTNGEAVNAGEYTFTYTFTYENYVTTTHSLSFEITAAQVSFSTATSYSFAYGEKTWGEIKELIESNSSAIHNSVSGLTVNGDYEITALAPNDTDYINYNAAAYSITVSFTPTDTNYDTTTINMPVSLTITKANLTFSTTALQMQVGTTKAQILSAIEALLQNSENSALKPTNITITSGSIAESYSLVGEHEFTDVKVETTDTNYNGLTDQIITLKIVAQAVNVSYTLNNLTTTYVGLTYTFESDFSFTLQGTNGYQLPNAASLITITINGSAYTGFGYDNATGEITISASVITGDIEITADGYDYTAPTITSFTVENYNTLKFTATDSVGITHYAITTSTGTPATWKVVSKFDKTNITQTATITEAGTYYVWVKDDAGNETMFETSHTAITITLNNQTENFISSVYFGENTKSNTIVALVGENSKVNLYAQLEDPTDGTYMVMFSGWKTSTSGELITNSDKIPYKITVSADTSENFYAYAHKQIIKANYTIKYYFQPISLSTTLSDYVQDTIKYPDEVVVNAEVGKSTNVSAKLVEGFTALAVTQQTVNDDGTTVVNVYYNRNSYTITLTAKVGTTLTIEGTHKGSHVSATATATAQSTGTATFTGHFGLEYTVSYEAQSGYFDVKITAQNITLDGNNKFTMPNESDISFETTATKLEATEIQFAYNQQGTIYSSETLQNLKYKRKNLDNTTADFWLSITVKYNNSDTRVVEFIKTENSLPVLNGDEFDKITLSVNGSETYDFANLTYVNGVAKDVTVLLTYMENDTKELQGSFTIEVTAVKIVGLKVTDTSGTDLNASTKFSKEFNAFDSIDISKIKVYALNNDGVELPISDAGYRIEYGTGTNDYFIVGDEIAKIVLIQDSAINYEIENITVSKLDINEIIVDEFSKDFSPTFSDALTFASENSTITTDKGHTIKGIFSFDSVSADKLNNPILVSESNTYKLIFTIDASDEISKQYNSYTQDINFNITISAAKFADDVVKGNTNIGEGGNKSATAQVAGTYVGTNNYVVKVYYSLNEITNKAAADVYLKEITNNNEYVLDQIVAPDTKEKITVYYLIESENYESKSGSVYLQITGKPLITLNDFAIITGLVYNEFKTAGVSINTAPNGITANKLEINSNSLSYDTTYISVSYANGSFKITGKKYYSSSLTITFSFKTTIEGTEYSFNKETYTITVEGGVAKANRAVSWIDPEPQETKTYTGGKLSPSSTTYQLSPVLTAAENTNLISIIFYNESKNQKLTDAPTEVGTYFVKVQVAASDYFNACETSDYLEFIIEPSSDNASITITVNETYTYNGATQNPNLTVKINEQELVLQTDYEISSIKYGSELVSATDKEFKDAGKYFITIEVLTGNYKGATKTQEISIAQFINGDNSATVLYNNNIEVPTLTYTGNELTFNNLTLSVCGEKLTPTAIDATCKITYSNNINASTSARFDIVVNTANYNFSIYKIFTIEQKLILNEDISFVREDTGATITTLTVKYTGQTYTIGYNIADGVIANQDDVKLQLTGNSASIAGNYTARISKQLTGEGSSNYKLDEQIGSKTLKWSIVRYYNVYFNTTFNGGEGEIPTKEIKDGEKYSEFINFNATKENGFTFIGWNTNKDATVAISEITINGKDVNLYAIYKKVLTVTVVYLNNLSEVKRAFASANLYNNNASTIAYLDSAINEAISSVPQGYEFLRVGEGDSSLTISDNITLKTFYTKSITLKMVVASNEEIYYSKATYGLNETNNLTLLTPALFTLSSPTSKASDGKFIGWYFKNTDGTYSKLQDQEKMELDYNATIYALFEATVNFMDYFKIIAIFVVVLTGLIILLVVINIKKKKNKPVPQVELGAKNEQQVNYDDYYDKSQRHHQRIRDQRQQEKDREILEENYTPLINKQNVDASQNTSQTQNIENSNNNQNADYYQTMQQVREASYKRDSLYKEPLTKAPDSAVSNSVNDVQPETSNNNNIVQNNSANSNELPENNSQSEQTNPYLTTNNSQPTPEVKTNGESIEDILKKYRKPGSDNS